MPGSRGKVSVKRDLWPSEEDSVSVPPSAPPMPATMPARGLCRRAGSSPGQPHFYQLGKAADAGERRAQLVRDGGQKNACGLTGLAGLGLADAQDGAGAFEPVHAAQKDNGGPHKGHAEQVLSFV